MRYIVTILLLLVVAGPARAVVTMHDQEQHGNNPVHTQPGAWSHVAAVLNSPGRTYWRDKGSTGFGTDYHGIVAGYCGDAYELNQLLKALAELPGTAETEVVLLPGAGGLPDQKGNRVGCHWRTRMVYVNIYDPKHIPAGTPAERFTVRLEVFLPDVPAPAAPASGEQLKAWIADLDSDRFAVREKAYRELAGQGLSTRNALRKALEANPSSEQRRRLEQLHVQCTVLQLGDLDVPKGLHVLSFDQLLERERPDLVNADPGKQWYALERLHNALEGSTELLPIVMSYLDDESYAAIMRRVKDAPKDTMQTFVSLLKQERPSAEMRAEQAGRLRELRKRLDEFCKGR